jgi:hypothetical protein
LRLRLRRMRGEKIVSSRRGEDSVSEDSGQCVGEGIKSMRALEQLEGIYAPATHSSQNPS